jgi:hypothetical protein
MLTERTFIKETVTIGEKTYYVSVVPAWTGEPSGHMEIIASWRTINPRTVQQAHREYFEQSRSVSIFGAMGKKVMKAMTDVAAINAVAEFKAANAAYF